MRRKRLVLLELVRRADAGEREGLILRRQEVDPHAGSSNANRIACNMLAGRRLLVKDIYYSNSLWGVPHGSFECTCPSKWMRCRAAWSILCRPYGPCGDYVGCGPTAAAVGYRGSSLTGLTKNGEGKRSSSGGAMAVAGGFGLAAADLV